jgi:hypothetical protein
VNPDVIAAEVNTAVRALTGPDYETAVVPEERRQHLTRWDAKAAHYEVVSRQERSG